MRRRCLEMRRSARADGTVGTNGKEAASAGSRRSPSLRSELLGSWARLCSGTTGGDGRAMQPLLVGGSDVNGVAVLPSATNRAPEEQSRSPS